MLKVGIADYGMNVWYGGFMDYEKRMEDIKAIGFDGLERLTPIDAADALNKATTLAKLRMDFATVLAPTLELKVQWTAAFGKEYIWTDVTANHAKDSLDLYCRRVNYLTEACKKYGIKAAVHNHLGCIVETQEQLEEFMEKCPEAGLVFDVGHMAVAGGNVREVFDKYYDRIVAIHLKDWVMQDPDQKDWWDRGYFCGLKQGNFPVDNEYVVKKAIENGYDKWIFIEHDTHLREPLEDLAESRKILKEWGV
ncbi:MAG: TIM barrel protein [Clostridia bacterium]|nr:TIM barrel protein [Clostridia bacterium]